MPATSTTHIVFFTGALASALYVSALLYTLRHWHDSINKQHKYVITISLTAVLLHLIGLIALIFTETGINLGLFPMLSLSSALAIILLLVLGRIRPINTITVAAYPLATTSIILSMLLHSNYQPRAQWSWVLSTHIVLSITAYGTLSVACIQSLLLSYQNKQLKRKHTQGIVQQFPPLQTTEKVLFELIIFGLILLTFAIGSGLMFFDNLFEQKLAHKTFFSMLAWIIFSILVLGRYYLGWRGNIAIFWTNCGFALLALGYLGSKFVLEIMLT